MSVARDYICLRTQCKGVRGRTASRRTQCKGVGRKTTASVVSGVGGSGEGDGVQSDLLRVAGGNGGGGCLPAHPPSK